MKRDMDLVRELLLKLEAEPLDGNLWWLDVDGFGTRLRQFFLLVRGARPDPAGNPAL